MLGDELRRLGVETGNGEYHLIQQSRNAERAIMATEVMTFAVDVIVDRRGEHRVELFHRAGRLDQQIVRVNLIDHDASRLHVVRDQLDLQIRRREQSLEFIYAQEAMIEPAPRIDAGGDVVIQLILVLHLQNDRYRLRRARLPPWTLGLLAYALRRICCCES
jgi:hypothetical protein